MSNDDFPWQGRAEDMRLWRGQIRPRLRRLLLDRQWFSVVIIATLFFSLTFAPGAKNLQVKDVATAQISLGALSFAACITSLVLSLTLNKERAAGWAVVRSGQTQFSALSQLIFVFAWSALAQLLVIASAFVTLVVGSGTDVRAHAEPVTHWILVACNIIVASYGFCQLIAVIRSLIQIGFVTIADFTEQHLLTAKNADGRTTGEIS